MQTLLRFKQPSDHTEVEAAELLVPEERQCEEPDAGGSGAPACEDGELYAFG